MQYCAFVSNDMRCPAEALPISTFCVVHHKYKRLTTTGHCDNCHKSIRAGDWSTVNSAGNSIHAKPCKAADPKTARERKGR